MQILPCSFNNNTCLMINNMIRSTEMPELFLKVSEIVFKFFDFFPSLSISFKKVRTLLKDVKDITGFVKSLKVVVLLLNLEATVKCVVMTISSLFLFTFSLNTLGEKFKLFNKNNFLSSMTLFSSLKSLPYGGLLNISMLGFASTLLLSELEKRRKTGESISQVQKALKSVKEGDFKKQIEEEWNKNKTPPKDRLEALKKNPLAKLSCEDFQAFEKKHIECRKAQIKEQKQILEKYQLQQVANNLGIVKNFVGVTQNTIVLGCTILGVGKAVLPVFQSVFSVTDAVLAVASYRKKRQIEQIKIEEVSIETFPLNKNREEEVSDKQKYEVPVIPAEF